MGDGAVTFSSCKLPPLQAGRYRIKASQRISRGQEQLAEFSDELALHATAPRFTLTPERIHSRHPAAGSSGDFARVLPHIALNSPTLPWLREPRANRERTEQPWLALLVFDSADPAPDVVTGPLSALLRAEAYPGSRRREPGDRPDDLCQWIDVDQELFAKVAPRAGELPFLTHVRTDHEQELAVVVANRLPAEHGVTTCCLVSLERALHILHPAEPRAVRLPVLESWTFSAATATEDFGGLMDRLGAATLRIRGEEPALAHGYALLEHTLRQGASSASWYRGPLIPTDASRTRAVPAGSDSADELLRYDERTGMFDVSLAAAWQLGRLLALADPELSVQIANWKTSGHRAQTQAAERKLLADQIGLEAAKPAAALQAQLAETLVAPVVEALVRE